MPTGTAPRPGSSKQTLEKLLRRRNGATIAEMIKATGWQAHSIRAALSRFRSAGKTIDRTVGKSGVSRYRILEGGGS